MIVLVDTSVWADFFNGDPSPEADTLGSLLEDRMPIATCGLILAEFFQGLRRPETIQTLKDEFLDLELLRPREPETYIAAADLFRDLRSRGVTIRSTIDCLIVRLAEENGARILAKDRDMRLILESGLCQARPYPLD